MSPQLRIVLTGMKPEEPSTSTWWNENRNTPKLLPSWEFFTARFKDRFVPSVWRLDALAKFYTITQGVGFTISDSILKNHHLMFSHPVLQLCVRTLAFKSIKVDAFVHNLGQPHCKRLHENELYSKLIG